MEFDDRSAIVTGAASGIGKGLVNGLAEQGIDVAIADIDVDGAEDVAASVREAHGVDSVAVECDVTDFDSAQRMVEDTVDAFGSVDILVNNAGFWTTRPFAKTDPSDWEKDIGICLEGTLNCTRAVVDHMSDNEYGRILNIVSDAGRIGEPHLAVYSGAKAGVIGFGRALSKELARFNVTVNNLALGVTETPGSQGFIEAFGKEELEGQYPMGRLGEVDDAVVGALFFLQDEAGYVTGQTISVSGGYTTK